MIYKMNTRVKFHQIGLDRKLTLAGLIEMFQDCGNLHGEDTGVTLEYQDEIKQSWVISSWQLIIDEWPRLGDEVVVSTWGYYAKRFLALRNFTLTSPDGSKTYAKADSHWVMLSHETGLPVRVKPEVLDMYGLEPEESKLPDDFPGRVIPLAENGEMKEPFEIVPYMLDANGHVNNCQYIKLARTQIREEFPYRRFGAEYVAQAHLGDVMIPRIAKLEDGWQIALLKPDGKPYLVTEWKE